MKVLSRKTEIETIKPYTGDLVKPPKRSAHGRSHAQVASARAHHDAATQHHVAEPRARLLVHRHQLLAQLPVVYQRV